MEMGILIVFIQMEKNPAANLYDLGFVLTRAGESMTSAQIKKLYPLFEMN